MVQHTVSMSFPVYVVGRLDDDGISMWPYVVEGDDGEDYVHIEESGLAAAVASITLPIPDDPMEESEEGEEFCYFELTHDRLNDLRRQINTAGIAQCIRRFPEEWMLVKWEHVYLCDPGQN
jgi:hypothetical protein